MGVALRQNNLAKGGFVGPLVVRDASDQQVDACRELWCAVIAHQFNLAFGRHVRRYGNGTYSLHPLEKQRARDWFGSRDFKQVCALANVEPEFIMRGVQARLAAERSAA